MQGWREFSLQSSVVNLSDRIYSASPRGMTIQRHNGWAGEATGQADDVEVDWDGEGD